MWAALATLTTRPCGDSRSRGNSRLVSRKGPMWLDAYVRSKPSLLRARVPDAGIVDQHVDRLTGREVRLGGAPHRAEIRHIEGHPVRPRGRVAALDRAQHGPGALFGAGGEHHAAAAGRERLDQGAADTGVGAGDEEGAIVKSGVSHPGSTG